MSDYITSIIRTLVPSLWGTALAWLITRVPLLEEVREELTGLGLVLVAVCIAGYYALIRKVEPHLPEWLRRVLVGSANAPVEYASPRGRHVADDDQPA